MRLEEYIKKAKKQLDSFQEMWIKENREDPEGWPVDLDEDAWGEQELAARFGILS